MDNNGQAAPCTVNREGLAWQPNYVALDTCFVDTFSISQGYKTVIKSISFNGTSKPGDKQTQYVVMCF